MWLQHSEGFKATVFHANLAITCELSSPLSTGKDSESSGPCLLTVTYLGHGEMGFELGNVTLKDTP